MDAWPINWTTEQARRATVRLTWAIIILAIAIGILAGILAGFAEDRSVAAASAQQNARWHRTVFEVTSVGPAQGRTAYDAFQQASLTAKTPSGSLEIQRLLPWNGVGNDVGNRLEAFVSNDGVIKLTLIDGSPLEAPGGDGWEGVIVGMIAGIVAAVVAAMTMWGGAHLATVAATHRRSSPGVTSVA